MNINKAKLKKITDQLNAELEHHPDTFRNIYPRITRKALGGALGITVELSYWKDSGGGYIECYYSLYDKPQSEVKNKRDLIGVRNFCNDSTSGGSRAEVTYYAIKNIVNFVLNHDSQNANA